MNLFSILTTTTANNIVNDDACTGLADIIAIAGFVLRVIQIAAPIILIIWGSIDLIKALIAGKEEEIKKQQSTLIKRLIAAVLLFLIPYIVTVVLGLIGSRSWTECWNEHHDDPILSVEDLKLNTN